MFSELAEQSTPWHIPVDSALSVDCHRLILLMPYKAHNRGAKINTVFGYFARLVAITQTIIKLVKIYTLFFYIIQFFYSGVRLGVSTLVIDKVQTRNKGCLEKFF